MASTTEETLKQAHKVLANAAGRLSGMISKKRINRGDLAHAALFAREGMVMLERLRDGLPPPKPKGETFDCPECGTAGATEDGCQICAAGPNG